MTVTHAELLAAIREVNELHNIGDAVYDVHERAFDHEPFDGSSWDHPRVLRYNAACDVIAKALKESQP